MGDLIHALWVVKNTPGIHDLYITDRRDLHSDGFIYPIDKTLEELAPIISGQNYVSTFQVYNDEPATNLNLWRRYAYSASWTQLLSNTFGVPAAGGKWIEHPKDRAEFSDKIVVHCSVHQARRGHHWPVVMDKYEGQCVFVGTPEEYQAFGYQPPFYQLPFYQPANLSEHFNIINSCKFFIGNQSAPLAMAHALDVPRLAMLNEVDKLHYVGEEKFFKNFHWIAQDTHHFEGLIY